MGMVLYPGCFAIGIGQGVPTGLVALMADLVPLAIAGLSMPMPGQAVTGRQWFDTAIGMLGVGVVSADVLDVGDAPLFAYVLPVLGMEPFAFATVLQ